jgi:hypothetical protein
MITIAEWKSIYAYIAYKQWFGTYTYTVWSHKPPKYIFSEHSKRAAFKKTYYGCSENSKMVKIVREGLIIKCKNNEIFT